MSGHRLEPTAIEGLLHVTVPVLSDGRGWFKESYSRPKLEALGLPRLDVVQNNISYNAQTGVARGIHAEPWDKYVSPAHGRVFAAIVELRDGAGFGTVETFELTVGSALYIPAGCGNSFCTLEPHTVYSYLVNDAWRPGAAYPGVNLFDAGLAIAWPLAPESMVLSDKDLALPPLADVAPIRLAHP